MSQENEQQIRAATNESIKSEENGEKCQSLFLRSEGDVNLKYLV